MRLVLLALPQNHHSGIMTDELDKKVTEMLVNNTFFLNMRTFNIKFEEDLRSLKNMLLEFNDEPTDILNLKKFIQKPNGLLCTLAVVGLSDEMLERILEMAQKKDSSLKQLINIDNWKKPTTTHDMILKHISNDSNMAEGIAKLLIYGNDNETLKQHMPLFELNKLSISKLNFDLDSLLDTILRYKIKGSYNANSENNAEKIIQEILDRHNISWERGKVQGVSRTMDFIIPNKEKPEMLIEVSFQTTTSSSMGDKAKNEISVSTELKKNIPKCTFIGFIDGAGWIFRKNDLAKLVSAFHNTFTFSEEHLNSFEKYLLDRLSERCYYENT